MTHERKRPLGDRVAEVIFLAAFLFCLYLFLSTLCGRPAFKEKTAEELLLDATIVGKSVKVYHSGDGKSHVSFFILYASGRAEWVSGKEFHGTSVPLVESQKTGKQ